MTDGTRLSDAEWRMACDEALAVLREARGWDLPGPRWGQAAELVAEIAAGLADGSAPALRQATVLLHLLSPIRTAIRLGDPPDLPVARAVRERIADLIDALASDARLAPGPPSPETGPPS